MVDIGKLDPIDPSDILKVIRERRSVRAYKDEEVPIDVLRSLVEAARWAPSAGNLQPWKFVLITDRRLIRAIKMVSPGMLSEPPALLVMCHDLSRARLSRDLQLMDLGAAMQNILLYAHSLGLGACPIGSFSQEGVAELLELPSEMKPVLMIAVGKPSVVPPPPKRLSLDELIIGVHGG